MRNFSLLAAVAIVACAHQSASVPEPISAATPEGIPEPAPSAVSEPAATPVIAAAPATVQPVVPAVAAIPAERRAVQSANAPKAVGAYSHAIQVPAGRVVFLSGQIAVDPVKDRLIAGDVVKQTERVMQNLKAVLDAAGATFDEVVKTTIFLTDLAEFAKVNEVYGRYFRNAPPARATVQVAALSRGARMAIECVAVTGGSARAGAVQSAQAPAAAGAYSQGIGVTPVSFLFVSGQIPLDPATGQPVSGDVGAQTERVMENLKAVLEAGGASFDKVVKTTIFVADIADVAKINDTYGRYFQKTPPARATVQVGALPRGARVEIDCVAAL